MKNLLIALVLLLTSCSDPVWAAKKLLDPQACDLYVSYVTNAAEFAVETGSSKDDMKAMVDAHPDGTYVLPNTALKKIVDWVFMTVPQVDGMESLIKVFRSQNCQTPT